MIPQATERDYQIAAEATRAAKECGTTAVMLLAMIVRRLEGEMLCARHPRGGKSGVAI